jgi:sec-independent protein translocase protein TatB
MFDIGFSELFVIAVVALLVLGPERLPKAARFVGLWVRRARAQWYSVKSELENELADDEFQRSLMRSRDQLQDEMRQVRDGLQHGAQSVRDGFEGGAGHGSPAPPAPAPATLPDAAGPQRSLDVTPPGGMAASTPAATSTPQDRLPADDHDVRR